MIRPALIKAADICERLSLWLAGLACAYLLFVTAFNVLARTLFDATSATVNLMIPAAVEQASYTLLILVMASLAASVRRGMIAVDLFVHKLPAKVQAVLARLWFLLAMALAVTLAQAFAEAALTFARRGDITQDLGLPLWIFYAAISVECAALAVICLAEGLTANRISEGSIS